MSIKTGYSKIGIAFGLMVAVAGISTFKEGWFDNFVKPVSAAETAGTTSIPEKASAPTARGYAPDGSVIYDIGNPNYDVNVAYDARKAQIDARIAKSWAHWREGSDVNEITGRPQAEIFAWDQNTVETVLWGAAASETPDLFMRGPDGKDRIPSFTYIFTSGLFRASIGDPDGVFRFNMDQSIKVVFAFVNKKGVKHTYSIVGYRAEAGGVIFLQEQALQIMDLFMTSKSMVVRVPTYGNYREMKFDCRTFDAKPFLRNDLTVASDEP